MKPVALVTGGSRGIGFAISRMLGENGYDLAINGVREASQVEDILQGLRETGANVVYCRGDVGTREGRDAILNALQESYDRVHLLVNNAGVAPKERLNPLQATEESFERLMRINLQGPYFLTQAIARWMVDNKKADSSFQASIINIGSISATVVSTNRGEYCMSKAGFAMHSKLWAVHLAEYGIPVYEVRPGVIRTDMTSKVKEKYDRLIAEGLTVQKRWGLPEDIARAVLSLSSNDFPYSTGEVFMVDGGLTTQRL